MLSMMCVLFEGCQFGTAAFGTVTPTSYRPTSDAGDDNDTTFTFNFEIINTSDIRVWERTDSTGVQTLKTETTHYAVTATNNNFTSGGTVTMVTAPATGVTLVIGRVIPYDQLAHFIDGGVISFASVENALDAVTLKVQQLEEMLNRAGLNPETDDSTLDMTIPNSVDRASQNYGWNASGEPTVISSGIAAGDAVVTAYAETYLDDASEAAFKQTTNLEAGVDFHAYTANGNTILTDAGVLSVAGLTTAADKMIYTTADDTYAVTPLTAAGRALVDDATAGDQLTTLGGAARDGSVAYTGTGVGFTDDDSMATVTATAPASGESVKAYVDAVAGRPYIKLVDSKATTTDGGTFTQGDWRKRTVAEETDTGGNVAVSSSVIVLDAGTYRVSISCPAYLVKLHQTRLRNTTGSTTLLVGTAEYCDTHTITNRSMIKGLITVAASQNLEIQHKCVATKTDNGFGIASDQGEAEIYTIAEFFKR